MAGVKTITDRVVSREDIKRVLEATHDLTTFEENVLRMKHGLTLSENETLVNENISPEMGNVLEQMQRATLKRFARQHTIKQKIIDKMKKMK